MIFKHLKVICIFSAIVVLLAFSSTPDNDSGYKGFSSGIDTLLKDKNKREYLEMRGIVNHSRKTEKGTEIPLDSAIISVYSINASKEQLKLVDFYTNKRGKCNFRLPLDGKFLITIGKKGFVEKSIQVNTKVPEHKKGAYLFLFSVDIFDNVKGLDASMLKKPVADINYVFAKDNFDYDLAYTNKVRNDLAIMYKNFFLLKKIQKDTVQASPTPADTLEKH